MCKRRSAGALSYNAAVRVKLVHAVFVGGPVLCLVSVPRVSQSIRYPWFIGRYSSSTGTYPDGKYVGAMS